MATPRRNNVTAVNTAALDNVASADNITQLAKKLKGYGIMPGAQLQRMLNKVNPVAKTAVFYVALGILIWISYLSVKGSLYSTHIGVAASIAMSIASVGILLLSYRWLKGGIKYFLLVIDIAIALTNAIIFVPAAINQDETAAQQRAYILQEKTFADSVLSDINTYLQSEIKLHDEAAKIEKEESVQEGPVRKNSGMVAGGTKAVIVDSIPNEGVTVSARIMNMRINSLSDVKKMGEEAHRQIAAQLNPYITEANTLRDNVDAWLASVNKMKAQGHLSDLQIENTNILQSLLEKMNKHPKFTYQYKPSIVSSVKAQGKSTMVATSLEIAFVAFLILLMILISAEEKHVNMPLAIQESQSLVISRVLAAWNIQLGTTASFDDTMTAALRWLESRPNIRTIMLQRTITFVDFLALYSAYGEDILDRIDDNDSYFGLHELSLLVGASPENYENIITTLTPAQWIELKKQFDDPEAIMDAVDIEKIMSVWKVECADGALVYTEDMEDAFQFLCGYDGEDVRSALKACKVTIKQYVALYNAYGEDKLKAASQLGANFTIGNLADALPDTISDDILEHVKASDMQLLDKYNISVVKYSTLSDTIKTGLINVITALEEKIQDEEQVKKHLATMMKDLSVFTDDNVAVWVALIQQIDLSKVILQLSVTLLNQLTVDTVEDFCGIINQFNTGAGIIISRWDKEFTAAIVQWKSEGLYDANLKAILKHAPLAGANGLVTLFTSYKKADIQRKKYQDEDQKAIAAKVTAATAAPSAAPEVAEDESKLTLRSSVAEPAPAEVVEAPAPVVEEVPVRRVKLIITIAELEKANTEAKKLTVMEGAFEAEAPTTIA